MGNVKIKQFSDKNKELIAGLTPEHAVYDVKGVRLDAKIGSILDIKNTVATQGKNLDNLTLKVNALAVGVFYGYVSNENKLPQDITERGYAYVGTDNPYKIYNFDGTQWKDSGTTIQATSEADEEDITYNENDKLTFKDRNNTNGMGYVILRKNKSFAEQITKANTIYEIRYEFILKEDITIPANCVLKFEGGSLSNGNIVFNNTILENASVGCFLDVDFTGNIKNDKIYLNWFGFTDRNHHYYNIFNSILSHGDLTLILEAEKEYNLDMAVSAFSGNFINIGNNVKIIGNNATINANYKPSDSGKYCLFLFQEKENLYVENLNVICDNTKQQIIGPHGGTFYSSAVYTFYLVNRTENVSINNVKVNKAYYAVKTSTSSSYTDLNVFKNVSIKECSFTCDMPIEGNKWANLNVRNSELICIADEDGCHCSYCLPYLVPKGESIDFDNSLYFEDCTFISMPDRAGEGVTTYAASDYTPNTYEKTRVYYTNCKFLCGGGSCSNSIEVYYNNCYITPPYADKASSFRTVKDGMPIFNNCEIVNIKFFGGVKILNSRVLSNLSRENIFSFEEGNLREYVGNIYIENSEFQSISWVFNNVGDNNRIKKIKNCHFKSEGGIFRLSSGGSTNTIIVFDGCNIDGNMRLVYGPDHLANNYFKFIGCTINNIGSNLTNTGNTTTKFSFKGCVMDGIFCKDGYPSQGSFNNKPSNLTTNNKGYEYFDETNNRPIWWTGTKWVDATGADV